MTKLTQQEIEQEREYFESWIEKDYFVGLDSVCSDWESERGCYRDFAIHTAFQAWLARAGLAKGEK